MVTTWRSIRYRAGATLYAGAWTVQAWVGVGFQVFTVPDVLHTTTRSLTPTRDARGLTPRRDARSLVAVRSTWAIDGDA